MATRNIIKVHFQSLQSLKNISQNFNISLDQAIEILLGLTFTDDEIEKFVQIARNEFESFPTEDNAYSIIKKSDLFLQTIIALRSFYNKIDVSKLQHLIDIIIRLLPFVGIGQDKINSEQLCILCEKSAHIRKIILQSLNNGAYIEALVKIAQQIQSKKMEIGLLQRQLETTFPLKPIEQLKLKQEVCAKQALYKRGFCIETMISLFQEAIELLQNQDKKLNEFMLDIKRDIELPFPHTFIEQLYRLLPAQLDRPFQQHQIFKFSLQPSDCIEGPITNGNEVYIGELVNGEYQGRGVLYKDGERYQGEFYKGKYHGYGQMVYRDGDIYCGQWLHGFQQGKGKYQFIDGSIYRGDVKREQSNGQGMHIWDNALYYGGWLNDKYQGFGVFVHFDIQECYAGQFRDGAASGKGIKLYQDNSIYYGEFENHMANGKGIKISADDTVFIGG